MNEKVHALCERKHGATHTQREALIRQTKKRGPKGLCGVGPECLRKSEPEPGNSCEGDTNNQEK